MQKTLKDSEIDKLLLSSSKRKRYELCDEVVILFLLTTGVTFPDLFSIRIKDILHENGSWKDEVIINREGGISTKKGILFPTNIQLRKALERYCDVRITKRYGCTFNWRSYRGLNRESKLLLNHEGNEFKTTLSKTKHEKLTSQQVIIKRIFEEAKMSREPTYTKICYNTFISRLMRSGFTQEQCKQIQVGNFETIYSLFDELEIKKIKHEIKKLFKSVKTAKEQIDPKVIYHYCSANSFVEVVKGGSLWFSDLLKMNDPNELIKNLKLSQEIALEIVGNHNAYKGVMDETNLGGMRVFSCSFSKRSDDLNQWRSYSDDGLGFSIGFDKKKLEKCLSKVGKIGNEYALNRMDSFNIEDVHYDVENSKRSIEEKFKILWRDFREANLLETNSEDLTEQINSYVWRASSMHKSSFYADEEEVRAFIRADLDETDIIQFRNGAYGLTSFIALNIKDAIREVILGPKCQSMVLDIEYFLKLYDIKAKIIMSEGEYR